MKITLTRRFGWIWVRGGRFLRVTEDHPTMFIQNAFEKRRAPDKDRIAHAGDLAIEIVNVKKNKVMGVAYLSGDAIRYHNYQHDPAKFREAEVKKMDVHTPGAREGETMESFVADLARTFIGVKFGADVGGFHYRLGPDESGLNRMIEMLKESYSYTSDTMTARGHVFATIEGGDRKMTLHFQPPPEATDDCATQFQIKMAVEAITKETE